MSQPTSTGISITITPTYTGDLIEGWGGVGSGLRPSYILESVVPIPGRVVAPAPLIEFARLGNGDASTTVASDPDHFIVTKVFSDLLRCIVIFGMTLSPALNGFGVGNFKPGSTNADTAGVVIAPSKYSAALS